jgi:hypothetical protein
MVEQLTGAASVAVLVLAYLLVLQAMTAAVLLLGQFIVLQARALAANVGERPPRSPEPAPVVGDEGESYRVGGGLLKR